jgi:hypothetical protein
MQIIFLENDKKKKKKNPPHYSGEEENVREATIILPSVFVVL